MQVDFLETLAEVAGFWNVNLTLLDTSAERLPSFDLGLRESIWQNPQPALRELLKDLDAGQRFYFVEDCFHTLYFLLRLPEGACPGRDLLLLGPFLYTPCPETQIVRLCEILELPEPFQEQVLRYHRACPVVGSVDRWDAVIRFALRHIYQLRPEEERRLSLYSIPLRRYPMNLQQRRLPLRPEPAPHTAVRPAIRMQDLLDAVAAGDDKRALELDARLDKADWLPEDAAHYTILINEYGAWGAQRGGVLSCLVNKVHREFSLRLQPDAPPDPQLPALMLRQYCGLVARHSLFRASPVVRGVVNDIRLHLGDDTALQPLARKYSINASYLSSQFKKELGISITGYLRAERIALAVQLIGAGLHSVNELAMRCGFSDPVYFCKCFQKETGTPIREYIRQNKSA